jgi:hypothetical protein
MAWQLVHIGDYRRVVELPMGNDSGSGSVPAIGHRTKLVFLAVAHFRLAQWDRFWSAYALMDAATNHEGPFSYHLMRLYGIAAYLKEVAGDRDTADALLDELDRSQASRGNVGVSGARLWIVQTLVRRGRFAEARSRLAEEDPVREVQNRDLDYEAWGELIAAEGAWDEAPRISVEARGWAEQTGLWALPAFADRLDGLAALARGELESGLDHLRRARATFERLGADWEVARIDLALAGALLDAGRPGEAAESARAALSTVERLDAPMEIAAARDLVARSDQKGSA